MAVAAPEVSTKCPALPPGEVVSIQTPFKYHLLGYGFSDCFTADPRQGLTIELKPYGVEVKLASMPGECMVIPYTSAILRMRKASK